MSARTQRNAGPAVAAGDGGGGSRPSLEGLYHPSSVVVVGASPSPEKWGYWLARGALGGKAADRPVWLVNEHRPWIFGERSYPSVRELPGPVELAVLAVPAARVLAAVRDVLEAGCRYVVVVASDLSPDARAPLLAAVRARRARLLGPNCMGLVDHGSRLVLTWGAFAPGAVGLVSQSGNLGLEIARLLERAGTGISRFVSLGDQWDIDAAEVVEDLVEDDATRVIALYVEGVTDGERFLAALAKARRAGKPVVLLSVGRSEAGARAARSHTGALVSGQEVMEAVARSTGALRVESAGACVDACVALLGGLAQGRLDPESDVARAAPLGWPPRRARVAVLADGGGLGALAADACARAGLELPRLSEATVGRLRGVIARGRGLDNPVDLAGAGEDDLENYARAVRALAGSGEVDAVLLSGYFGAYAGEVPGLEAAEVRVARDLGTIPAVEGVVLAVQSMARQGPALEALREAGIPVYERVEHAVAGLAALELWRSRRQRAIRGRSRTRPAGGALAGAARRGVAARRLDGARALLEALGVPFPPAITVSGPGEVVEAASRLGYPVVLKVAGEIHKSELGGVVVGLEDDEGLLAAAQEMQARLSPEALVVERMVGRCHGVEMLVGARRDPCFGPLVLVGSGGVTAEVDADVAVGFPPLDEEELRGLLAGLRLAPRVFGYRGLAPLDLKALATVAASLVEVLEHDDGIVEVEVNPLLVGPEGAVALDARLVRR